MRDTTIRGGLLSALALTLGAVGLLPGTATATPSAVAAPAAAVAHDPAVLGTAPAVAAGSCWEIKQKRPAAPSGAYWLLTPRMTEPQQFYCDQVTDGGGWVLIGKGRNAWTEDDEGIGSAAALLDPGFAGGADTHEYPTQLVNQLLNGARPVDLTEGIRVRRAMDVNGSRWQEVRFKVDTRQTGWSWAFGAKFPIQSWSFNPESPSSSKVISGTGGVTEYFGTGSTYDRVRSVPNEASGWTQGWSYGTGVSGATLQTSYLYSATSTSGTAVPVAQVYIRPRVTSDDVGFAPIPAAGTPKVERRVLHESNADALPWGVSGVAGSTAREGSVEVQDLVEADGRMYVAGNFRYVQRDLAGTGQVEQPFLAAFDVDSGAWISSFRPVLDEQVRALDVLPNGSIVAGGDFSTANGTATHVVALDPVTGATDPSFNLTVEDRTTGGFVRIWDFESVAGHLYIGGEFTHLMGGGRTTFSYMRNLARVRATDGRTLNDWNPEMAGAVIDLDGADDGSRVYAAGFFNTSRGIATRKAAAVLTTFLTRDDGTVQHLADPLWAPVWSHTVKDYQQAIVEDGGNVWSGGSEHSIFGFDRTSFVRRSTTILHAKGDIQTMVAANGVLYAGSHSNNQFSYTGASTWSSSGPGGDPWTQAHSQHFIGAYDSTTGAPLGDFTPHFESRSGIWASVVDSKGRLWLGGDMDTARTRNQGGRWIGGFARFQLRDAQAPVTPDGFRVVSADRTQVTLGWDAAPDASGVRYQVLRGDRPIATTTDTSITLPFTVPEGQTERYWVRAADGVGNISASTPALETGPAGNTAPTAAFDADRQQLTVAVDASASADPDGSIASYAWDFGDGVTDTGLTASHDYAEAGSYLITLTVTDNEGASASTTTTVEVTESVPVAIIARNDPWSWRYEAGAPAAGWNGTGFDDSAWQHAGVAPLGWAPASSSGQVTTTIDTFSTTSQRPITAYFRRSITIDDPTRLTEIALTSVADDGAVFYVNGVEVGRQNMRDGTVTSTTYAPSARRLSVAEANPVVLTIPASLLVAGENVIAAETHVNYKATPDLTFHLRLDAVYTT